MDQEYNIYAEKLQNYINLNIFVIFMIICVIVIFSVIIFKMFRVFKVFPYMILIGVLISVLIYITSIYPFQYDINNNNYIEYIGEFFVEKSNYCSSKGGPSYILIRIGDEPKATRYIFAIDDTDVYDNTLYYGKIVWAEKSKVLVNIENYGVNQWSRTVP